MVFTIAQHLDDVGHLGDHGKIVGDVDGGSVEALRRCRAWRQSTSTWVVTSSAVVGSSNMIRSGRDDMAMAVMARCSWPPDTWCG
jgi:hypothetical protein